MTMRGKSTPGSLTFQRWPTSARTGSVSRTTRFHQADEQDSWARTPLGKARHAKRVSTT